MPSPTDMRLYDAMPYFAMGGMATVDSLPPAGCHLSCHTVGALIALWKGGGILSEESKKRWPAVFQDNNRVYKVRRPMGDPFLM
jgi:hypothetical protein